MDVCHGHKSHRFFCEYNWREKKGTLCRILEVLVLVKGGRLAYNHLWQHTGVSFCWRSRSGKIVLRGCIMFPFFSGVCFRVCFAPLSLSKKTEIRGMFRGVLRQSRTFQPYWRASLGNVSTGTPKGVPTFRWRLLKLKNPNTYLQKLVLTCACPNLLKFGYSWQSTN